MSIIYLDHAATSYPKPNEVKDAMLEAVSLGNPGRAGHALAREASAIVTKARKNIAQFFGTDKPESVIFTKGATEAINLILKGFPWKKGDHIIASGYEHNAGYRALYHLQQEFGVSVTFLQGDEMLHDEKIARHITDQTKMLFLTHGSNVDGALLPLEIWGNIAKSYDLKLAVDAAQTAGVVPIHMKKDQIHYLAVPGHKGLLGPQGVGILVLNEEENILSPLIHGGTGTYSEKAAQPKELPFYLESGTLNVSGIAGLNAGINCITKRGLRHVYSHEQKLLTLFLEEVQAMPQISIIEPATPERLGTVSITIKDLDSHEVAVILDEHYNIAVRAGLHCSPLAHQKMGTLETGSLRVSFGYSNQESDVETLIKALKEIIQGLLG